MPITDRELDWRLHIYFEVLSLRGSEIVMSSPHGRLVIEGGSSTGSGFKSKIPRGVRYTDREVLAAYNWTDAALRALKDKNLRWYAAIWLYYERLPDMTRRKPGQCLKMMGISRSTFHEHKSKGRKWISNRPDTLRRFY